MGINQELEKWAILDHRLPPRFASASRAFTHKELEDLRSLFGSLAAQSQSKWKLHFSSSFKDDGPTLLIIKDKEGFIYGGYASQPWERHGDFFGDMKSFFFNYTHTPKHQFSDQPDQIITYNGSDGIPNGIGFGGRTNHLDCSYLRTSIKAKPFPAPRSAVHVYPKLIVYTRSNGVIPRKADRDRPLVLKGTVLERFKDDRHMLNMVGIANSSE